MAAVLGHIEKNLSLLANLPRVALNNIRDIPGARKAAVRVGRGPGSGRGKTCGHGHKGQGQRNPSKPRLGFEGGQTPFYLRIPEHGFKNKFRKEYELVDLGKLQLMIDQGRINPKSPIDMKVLRDSGAVSKKITHGVKLLAKNSDKFNSKLDIEVSRATPLAISMIEQAGGKVTCAHYNKLGLRYLLKPERFIDRLPPRRARPKPKQMTYYTDPHTRGYLADEDEIRKLRKMNQRRNKPKDYIAPKETAV
ncbi:39S ribosomal protein L15, mitochondrial [Trichoplax sp. H2]|nr:39S ribosomal protein L15, mitochondrial [Trichoplax sp. H2]|eukprot:RDD46357.1 39S ribosomal protein L15, mitochondrial [Trichoplax sp. H2]